METKRIEEIKMVIRFFNMQAGSSIATRAMSNQEVVNTCLDRVGGDVVKVKNHIRTWVAEHKDEKNLSSRFAECMEAIEVENHVAPVPAPAPVSDNQVGGALGILEQALMEVIKKQSVPQIEADIKSECTKMLQDFIKEEYGTIERKITTVINGVPKKLNGVQHEKFETVLKFVANNEPVFLTGPAGSGKNVLCKQIADALGLKFYFTNAVTQEYKLTGFTDAMGNFQETQFHKAFTQGGVFMLDEMDASIPEVLVILNAAIANRYFDFPAPIGYVEAHPDFRVIAAGNTVGHGADFEYVGRNQLDGASLDRFAVVKIDYSVQIENSVAMDIELADFCRDFRKAANKAGVQVIISYRGIGRLAKMMQLLSINEALETCLIKGMDKDDVHMIEQAMTVSSKYRSALREIAA